MERQHPHPPTSSASEIQVMNVRMAIMAAMARPYSVGVIIWGAGLEVNITSYLFMLFRQGFEVYVGQVV